MQIKPDEITSILKQRIEGLDADGAELTEVGTCLLYTSDAADDMQCVDLGGRRIIKKKFF